MVSESVDQISNKSGTSLFFLPEWVAICLLESSLQARVAFGINIIIEFRIFIII